MRPRALLSALLIATPIAAVAAADPAWADAGASAAARSRAAKLKRDGDAAMVNLHYDEALDAYSQAYELVEDPALLYNRGRALQGLGRYPEALEQLEAFDARAPPQLKARVPALDELIAEVRSRITTLTVNCNVPGARIFIENKIVGTTPLAAPLKVNAGATAVQIEAEGYVTYRKTLELPGGGALAVNATLSARSTDGMLVVRSPVPGARVSIDDTIAGNVPVEVSLSPGPHRIVVERDGYKTASTSATVVTGRRRLVVVPLDPSEPITQRWWFWTGIGLVVVAGVALTAALLTERRADRGSIEPGQVSAPIRF